MLGGARASEVTTEVTAMVDGLLEAFKEQATRAGHNGIVTKLSATEAQSQVVAGTNYFVKVRPRAQQPRQYPSRHLLTRVLSPPPTGSN